MKIFVTKIQNNVILKRYGVPTHKSEANEIKEIRVTREMELLPHFVKHSVTYLMNHTQFFTRNLRTKHTIAILKILK